MSFALFALGNIADVILHLLDHGGVRLVGVAGGEHPRLLVFEDEPIVERINAPAGNGELVTRQDRQASGRACAVENQRSFAPEIGLAAAPPSGVKEFAGNDLRLVRCNLVNAVWFHTRLVVSGTIF